MQWIVFEWSTNLISSVNVSIIYVLSTVIRMATKLTVFYRHIHFSRDVTVHLADWSYPRMQAACDCYRFHRSIHHLTIVIELIFSERSLAGNLYSQNISVAAVLTCVQN